MPDEQYIPGRRDIVESRVAQPFHITLTHKTSMKSGKVFYEWEISIYAATPDIAVNGLKAIEERMQIDYPNSGGD